MAGKVEEKPIEKKETISIPSRKAVDEILATADTMSTDDLTKPDAGLKLLTAVYKDKANENRQLQDKIEGVSRKNQDLSNKLSVATERLRHAGDTNVAMSTFSTIAGATIVLSTFVSTSWLQRTFFGLGVGIYIVCLAYYLRNTNIHKDIEYKE